MTKEMLEATKRMTSAVNQRRTEDNTMAKRKRTKGQTLIYEILHRKLRIEQHLPHYKLKINSTASEG